MDDRPSDDSTERLATHPPVHVREAFGRELAAVRNARGWSTLEAENRSGITRKTWNRVEAGYPARASTLRAIERAFGVKSGTISRSYHTGTSLIEALASAEPSETSADEPITLDQLTAHVGRLSVWEMRVLRDRIDGMLSVLAGPGRATLLEEAAAAARPYYERWRAAVVELENARAVGDKAREQAALPIVKGSLGELNKWLAGIVPDISKDEVTTVLTRVQELHGVG